MNDLADDKELAFLEHFPGAVREIDGSLDAVTKTKLLGQPHRGVAGANDPALPANLVDDVAAVMRFDLFLHRRHDIRRAQIHFLARCGAAGNEVRAQNMNVATLLWSV